MARSRLRELAAAAAVAAVVGGVTEAQAAIYVYEYTGKPFTRIGSPYTTDHFVEGSFTIELDDNTNIPYNPFTSFTSSVQSFSFSDGIQTATPDVATQFFFNFSTDDMGRIVHWLVEFYLEGGGYMITTHRPANGDNVFSLDTGANSPGFGQVFESGAWTVRYVRDTGSEDPDPAPEPASLLLTALGLGGLALVRRRRVAGGQEGRRRSG